MRLEPPPVDDRSVWDVWLSVYRMPALAAADELGLFEALEAQPASADELGERLGLNPQALRSVLPLLASLGFLAVREGRYHPTETARAYLLHDSPYYWGGAFSIHRADRHVARFVAALKADPAESLGAFGQGSRPVDSWESGELGAELAQTLAAFMHSHSLPAAVGLARLAAFDGMRRLLDVGGGSGCFSIALAQQRPRLHATVMDLPAMTRLADRYIEDAGVRAQVDTRVVDMFRGAWPEGYDAIFMSNIFHDWNQDTCAVLAARSLEALPPGGRILLHEMLLADDGSGPLAAAGFSMMMLAGTQGRQYSFSELARILTDAGFVDPQVTEAHGDFSLVSARKPDR